VVASYVGFNIFFFTAIITALTSRLKSSYVIYKEIGKEVSLTAAHILRKVLTTSYWKVIDEKSLVKISINRSEYSFIVGIEEFVTHLRPSSAILSGELNKSLMAVDICSTSPIST
jgi:hypothetical protein